ncbi:RNA polymerase sigma-70 factor, ECF subfamily [Cohaesibacter marisflavi]|uniref:RNA polymerase sigma factor n=1 Tax=Cohaesibacter marisflavi TaxID=655353 RepID=A0A1I5CDN6_9HYPH|nr:RNA polymerase sigma factor [Cohaesibacter marisflavi]SFN85119.1 RNA polymerase sigma-70 factor, ECF subfamily [Cohaesibacter marisflavi]
MKNATMQSVSQSDIPETVTTKSQLLQARDLVALSDDELLGLIALGQEEAFQALVERHVDRGYAVAYRILQDGPEAEDVLQDAFLQVWTRRGNWKAGRAKFSTWLFKVVTNRCIDLLRKNRTSAMDELPDLKDDSSNQSAILEMQEAIDLLEGAVAQLPDQQRIAIVFSYNESMSNSEIAEIMETSVSAVESLLKRGRQKLRQILKAHSSDILSLFTQP